MPFQIASRGETVEQQPILDNAGFPAPNRIIVRQIDLVANGESFDFVFKDPDRAHNHGNIQQIIYSLHNNAYQTQGDVPLYHRPLDLNLSSPAYIIFWLSSGWRWRFSSKYRAVTLGKDVQQTYYANLRHVVQGKPDRSDPFPHGQGDCRIVYFMAAPREPDPPGFADAINLNVDIVRDDVAGEPPNFMPIVIDPDIRNPGGSEP